jgi:hypothetical protein
MQKLSREEMMEWIENHMRFVRETEYFNGAKGGIWLAADNQDTYNGDVIYEYHSQDRKNRTFGVLNKWESELKNRGWWSEWQDAGTICLYPND